MTSEAQYIVMVHREVSEWLSSRREPRLQAQVRLDLLELAARGHTRRVKSTSGANMGWLRSPLGGGGACHYYLWWLGPALAGASPDEGAEVMVRAVRHHDETDHPLAAGDPSADYARWSPQELLELTDPEDLPFKESQVTLARGTARVRTIRGLPGTGKTSGLLYAAALPRSERVLYVTRNWRLARDALGFLRAFGATERTATVLTFEELLDRFEGVGARRSRDSGHLERFQRALSSRCRIDPGPWRSHMSELYGELHGYLVGRAVPVPFRGKPASRGLLLDQAAYESYRESYLDSSLARIVFQVGSSLEESGLLPDVFPGPVGAARATAQVESGHRALAGLAGTAAVLVDEVQDLTLRELYFLVRLVRALRLADPSGPPDLLLAGDESQTVSPTDFSWGETADLINLELGCRLDHELDENLRSPSRIAELVSRSWRLYSHIRKDDRPRAKGTSPAPAADSGGRVMHVTCASDAELAQLARSVESLPHSILVYPGSAVPADRVRAIERASEVLPATAVKGLEFASVGVLDAGRQLAAYEDAAAGATGSFSRPLSARTMADQLRVCLSRATQNLLLIDLCPDDNARRALDDLCAGIAEEYTGPGACLLLGSGERDPIEAMHLVADASEMLLEDHPGMALTRSRQAQEECSRLALDQESVPAYLVQRLAVLRGVSAAIVAMAEASTDSCPATPSTMLEAVEALRGAGLEDDASAVLAICQARHVGTALHATVASVRLILDRFASLHPLLRDRATDALVTWCGRIDPVGPGSSNVDRKALGELLADVQRVIEPSRPEVMAHVTRLRRVLEAAARKEESVEEQLKAQWVQMMRDGYDMAYGPLEKKAEKCYRTALRLARELGPDRGRMAVTLARLGALNYMRGLFAQAEKDLTRALSFMDPGFGRLSSVRVEAMRDLAGAIMCSRSPGRAEPWVRKVLEVTEELYGECAEDLVKPLLWLSHLLEDQGNIDAALSSIERALDICDEVGTPLDDSMEKLLADHESLLRLAGRVEEADGVQSRRLELGQRAGVPGELVGAPSEALVEHLVTGGRRSFTVGRALVEGDEEGAAKLVERIRSLSDQEIDRLGERPDAEPGTQVCEFITTPAARLAMKMGPALWSASEDTADALGRMFEDPSPKKRALAAHLLGQIIPSRARVATTDRLLTNLKDADVEVREAAADALRRLSDPGEKVLVALLEATCGSDARVRSLCMLALAHAHHLGEIVVPRLGAMLGTDDAWTRSVAVRALQYYEAEAEEALPALRALLDDVSPEVRCHAVRAVTAVGEPPATLLPLLTKALQDPSPDVRGSACVALADALGRAAEPVLERLQVMAGQDESDAVRCQAAEALRAILDDVSNPEWLDEVTRH